MIEGTNCAVARKSREAGEGAWQVGEEKLGNGQDIHKGTAEARAAQAALTNMAIDTDSLIVGRKLRLNLRRDRSPPPTRKS